MKQDPEYLLNLSIVFNELGRFTEGQETYEQALHWYNKMGEQQWKNDLAKIHFQAGNIYLKKEQLHLALEEYLKALNLQPYNMSGHIQLTHILWKLKQKKQAIEHLQSIITHSPQLAEAHTLLAKFQTEEQSSSSTADDRKIKPILYK